jgi:hypothetical protein
LNKKINILFRKKSFFYSNILKISKYLSNTKYFSRNVLILKNINSRIDLVNIVSEKSTLKSSKKLAKTTWTQNEIKKHLVFHIKFMIKIITIIFNSKMKTKSTSKFHINNLSKLSQHYKTMLYHLHAKKLRIATQVEYDAIDKKKLERSLTKKNYKCVLLNWVFIYKINFDDYLIKYKIWIMIRDDM